MLGLIALAADAANWQGPNLVRTFGSLALVLALLMAGTWLLRRGTFGVAARHGTALKVETAVPLGERRSLVIVSVEGRRLLLGLTPASVAMVAELAPAAESFGATLERARGSEGAAS